MMLPTSRKGAIMRIVATRPSPSPPAPMDRVRRRVLLGGVAAGATLLGLTRMARTAGVASPSVSGPLPGTREKGILVWEVEGLGYLAEEYLLSGQANIYRPVSMADAPDVASRDSAKDLGKRDFSRELLSADQPFTTRLIVYRPSDARRFSGRVIVETLHPSGGGSSPAWGAIHAFFAARGDAYVGVQHPLTISGLKAADPARYGALSAADPTQLWGMLAQAGFAVRAGALGPLQDKAVKRILMTGYSYTGVATATFANYHHGDAKLADGRNIFDGYLPMADAQYVRPLDVPVMRLNTQSDFNGFGGLNNRRPDDERYRHYEIAGASHVAKPPPPDAATAPAPGKIATPAGQPRFSPSGCQAAFPAGSRPNDFPLYLAQEAMFDNMYRWIEMGLPPPPSVYIETNPDGSTRVDQWGNAKGGVRLPQVSVPVACYGVGTDTCLLFGYTAPFDAAKCRSLYGDHAKYLALVQAAADRLVAERWVLPGGAVRLTAIAAGGESF
jgi:hypothetical protein